MIEVSNPTPAAGIVTPSPSDAPPQAPTKAETAALVASLPGLNPEPAPAPAVDVAATVEAPAAITLASLDRGRLMAYIDDLLQQGDKQLTANGNHGDVTIGLKVKIAAEDGSFLRKITSVGELKLGKLERQEFRTDAASKGGQGLTLWTPKAAVAQAQADAEKAEKKPRKPKAKKGDPVPDVALPLGEGDVTDDAAHMDADAIQNQVEV